MLAFCVLLAFAAPGALFAATNDSLTAALQRGLFEEEANHNLPAAIQAYQSVINQFDQNRKLAATAVFRLGECYRKQGKTNEAAAQYSRIVREFPDQAPLLTLSQQNLAAMRMPGSVAAVSPPPATFSSPGTQLTIPSRTLRLPGEVLTSAEEEEVKRIQRLIKDSPDLINARDSNGATPLHNAAANGQLIVARFLLDNGAEMNSRDNNSAMPLHRAAEAGHKSMVELLLDRGAELSARGNSGRTALHLAAGSGFKNIVDMLLARGADPNAKTAKGETALQLAAAKDRKAVVESLLDAKGDVNHKDDEGRTALHAAARAGNTAMIEALLDSGADVNARDNSGVTPLAEATFRRNMAAVEVLLEHKANPNLSYIRSEHPTGTKAAYYPLYDTVREKNQQLAKLLLENGADPNLKSGSGGFTPLGIVSAETGDTNLAVLLLRHKADPNIASESGLTPLHTALAVEPLREIVLEAGANVNATNNAGHTPLHWAVGANLIPAAQDLIGHGANLIIKDATGRTPLHWAAALKNQAMTDLLLEKGADPNVVDQTGSTPLELARKSFLVNSIGGGPGFGVNYPSPQPHQPMGGVAPPRSAYGAGRVSENALAESLKKHGALEDVPRPDLIQFRRPDSAASLVFAKSTPNYNQFTLLETIAAAYDLLADHAPSRGGSTASMQAYAGSRAGVGFPDFSRIRLLQPSGSRPGWKEVVVDLRPLIEQGNCAEDVLLPWGTIVELPEADHVLNATWTGFTLAQSSNLVNCLRREVEVVVKGKSSRITLEPGIDLSRDTLVNQRQPSVKTEISFWIKPVLLNSGLLLASSDLSQVKVTRRDPKTGEAVKFTDEKGNTTSSVILDCSEGNPAPDFFLRDGDLIEVPDKT